MNEGELKQRVGPGAVITTLVLVAGCTVLSPGARQRPVLTGIEWPPDQPRVRLEKVIRTRADLGRTFRSWFTRRDDELFTRPYGVAWDEEDLLVADPGAGEVVRLGADGTITRSAAGALGMPIGITACDWGVVVSDPARGAVVRLDSGLRVAAVLLEGLDRPTGVACLGTDVAVVETGAHRVVLRDASGELAFFGQRGNRGGEFNFPTAVAEDNLALWIGDVLNFRIQLLDPATGEAVLGFGRLGDSSGEMPRLKGIAIDPWGRIWVSDAHLDEVAVFSRDGLFLMSLGGSGSSPGRFAFPAGVAIRRDGAVAVADSLNRRIQLLRITDNGDD